jgi:hypothetical protein
MRTTIRMNEELARRAKAFAAQRDRTFTQLIEEAVADFLARQSKPQPHKKFILPIAGDPRHKVTADELKRAIQDADTEYDLKKLGGGLDGHS